MADESTQRDLYRGIGSTIRKFRNELNPKMKQENLADSVGLSRASIVNIEKGRHRIQVHVLYDIARALGCEPVHLLPPLEIKPSQLPKELRIELRRKFRPKEISAVTRMIGPTKSEQSK